MMQSILRQSDHPTKEGRMALQHGMSTDLLVVGCAQAAISKHAALLQSGHCLPIGSVEFIKDCMSVCGIKEPDNFSYPPELAGHLHRIVRPCRAGSIIGRWFIKPQRTKLFTGFVFDTMDDPTSLTPHDQEQHDAFLRMPADATIWISGVVSWRCEHRIYVHEGRIIGRARYDDGPEDAAQPDAKIIQAMIDAMPRGVAAYGLDVGVLSTGETALVEVNDAWALGHYQGGPGAADYFAMLWARWSQMLSLRGQGAAP